MRPHESAKAARADSSRDPRRVDQLGRRIDTEATPQTPTTQADRIAIGAVHVGERHRRDLGDIDALASSIADIGLLHPIVVRPDGQLIAGERRLRAAERLGWSEIPVTILKLDAVVRGEFAENSLRKDFTLSEAVAIKRALEPLERAEAKERQREGGRRGGEGLGKLPAASNGRAADKAAKASGLSRRTLEKAEAVVDAAEAEPDRFGKLVADMDRTGKADGPFKRLGVIRQAAAIRAEPPPLPARGPYRVIVADVPWPYEKHAEDPTHRATYSYPTMSIVEMIKMGDAVRSIAAPDSILWFWTINYYMREAYDIVEAWGFEAKTILTWVKPRAGFGDWLKGQTEHCLLATRGKPVVELRNESTRLDAPLRAHSEKPREFYELVERLCPASRYCELFARTRRPNWDRHGGGDELKPDVSAASPPPAAPPTTISPSLGSSAARRRRRKMLPNHLQYLNRAVLYRPLLIEYRYRRDAKVDLQNGSWESIAVPPPGGRWVVFDILSSDRRTGWRRISFIGH
jgi:N6-adenosine-specific RNA methylase IME4